LVPFLGADNVAKVNELAFIFWRAPQEIDYHLSITQICLASAENNK
jgi:hypothetical protein